MLSPSFAPNTHKLYILKHCINIVLILQRNHINPSQLIFRIFFFKYNYPLIASFDIFCQLEVNWIYNQLPTGQQVRRDRVPQTAIISVSDSKYSENVSRQCNLYAQIEQVQDKI